MPVRLIIHTVRTLFTALLLALSAGITIPLFAQSIPARQAGQPATDDYLHYYQRSDYRGCINAIEEALLPKRKLKSTEKLIYAECLFQAKRLRQSAEQYDQIVVSVEGNRLRAANRLLDIYKMGEKDIPLRNMIDFLKREKRAAFIALQMQPILIEKHKVALFLELYQVHPLNLNNQQWSVLTASLNEEQFKNVISLSKLSPRQQKLKWAAFWLTQGKGERALQILQALHNGGQDIEAVKLTASIHWQRGDEQRALNTLAALKNQGIRGYRELAEFFFEHGRPKQALATARAGIKRDYSLHDIEVFYLMAMGKFGESAYLLEKYMRQQKIARFRFHNIQQDYFRQGTEKQYWQGIARLAREMPEMCVDALRYQYAWDTPQAIKKSVDRCKELEKPGRRESFLFLVDAKHRYDLMIALVKDQKNPSDKEKLLLGKAYLLGANNAERSIEILSPLEKKKTFAYKPELRYYLGLAYVKKREFSKAEGMFAQIIYQDSILQWLHTLVYQERWQDMKLIMQAEPMKRFMVEKRYFEAIWSLSSGQTKQGELLLEQYLHDAGRYGNRAVYFLFMLKYFKQDDDLLAIVKALVKYPGAISGQDWKQVSHLLGGEVDSELAAFAQYWYARTQLLHGKTTAARKRLTNLRKNKHAELLAADIDFLLLRYDQKGGANDYLMKFPDSPFRILLKQQ